MGAGSAYDSGGREGLRAPGFFPGVGLVDCYAGFFRRRRPSLAKDGNAFVDPEFLFDLDFLFAHQYMAGAVRQALKHSKRTTRNSVSQV